jgi:hypothetical protein
VTATNKHIPSKRLKTWHREGLGRTVSLKAFARSLLNGDDKGKAETASRWLTGKVAP